METDRTRNGPLPAHARKCCKHTHNMNSEASGSPQQRIITSEQWVFDRSAKDDVHADCRPRKASSSTKEERELRRRQRELENEQLQQEYNTVRQENAKLKNVIARLRQDIDVYMQLLAGSAPAATALTRTANRRSASDGDHAGQHCQTAQAHSCRS